jgi:K+/H+ antiporter YhaU regulatory subunit KhtT
MGANTIFNLLDRSDILMVTEGLDVLRIKLPPSLSGKTLANSGIRQKTGCNVVAIVTEEGMQFNLDPNLPLPAETEIILIGSVAAEKRFLDIYGNH